MSMERDAAARRPSDRLEPASSDAVAPQASLFGPAAGSQRFGPRSSNGGESSLELHIEELVLNGFEPAQRYTIGDALERELTRLLTEHGVPIVATRDIEIAHLNGGAIAPQPGANAEATGIQLARAIYGGLVK